MLALDVDVAVVTNVELDHHATYGSLARGPRGVPRVPRRPAHAVILDRPELLALRGAGDVVAFDVTDAGARAERVTRSPGAGTTCT